MSPECWREPDTTAHCARSHGGGRGEELVVRYRIEFEGAADILGLSFAYPESEVR